MKIELEERETALHEKGEKTDMGEEGQEEAQRLSTRKKNRETTKIKKRDKRRNRFIGDI